MSKIQAIRYHDFCAGHRVAGHENKCAHLHGHNYRVTFHCAAKNLDTIGRVLDFSVIKEKLCMWLEDVWDHKFLAWEKDTFMQAVKHVYDQTFLAKAETETNTLFFRGEELEPTPIGDSLVFVPFNPTAENMAKYLVEVVGPEQLAGTGVELVKVEVEETRKCSASFEVGQ